MGKVRPPAYLKESTKRWFHSVVSNFELEEHHVRLLIVCCESWDRAQQARAALATHGITYEDRLGNVKPRPEVQIERDSRIAFIRALRELNLSEAPDEVRPPALKFGGKQCQ